MAAFEREFPSLSRSTGTARLKRAAAFEQCKKQCVESAYSWVFFLNESLPRFASSRNIRRNADVFE